jgi:hypothetical protein
MPPGVGILTTHPLKKKKKKKKKKQVLPKAGCAMDYKKGRRKGCSREKGKKKIE